MEGTRVASRYAKSFIDLSIEQGQLEQAYKDMLYVAEMCKGNHELVVFLKSPVIKTDAKQEVLKKLFVALVTMSKSLKELQLLIQSMLQEQYLVLVILTKTTAKLV